MIKYSEKILEQKNVTLTLTHQCNLKCSYCYETTKDDQCMSIETGKSIVYDELTKTDGFKRVQFDFFGGEPFLCFEAIKEIVDYAMKIETNKKFNFFITTNGTFVHGNIKKWLIEHRDFVTCGLSLDGTKEMHNINRCNSFDDIDIDFFKNTYPKQDIKMTISVETLPSLYDGVVFLSNKYNFGISCNFAYGIDWHDEKNRIILSDQLKRLIEFYIEHPDVRICSLLSLPITQIAMPRKDIIYKWCGVGTSMITYDIDGKTYPCQFFMPMSIGHKLSFESLKIEFKDEIKVADLDSKCQKCIYLQACPTCYGANYLQTKNILSKDVGYCELMKIVFKARAYLMAQLWDRKRLTLSEDEIMLLLKSIELINNQG